MRLRGSSWRTSDFHCPDCHLGKETRQPFPDREENPLLQPGEIIHGDLSGKMPQKALDGSSYFLLLKDERTSFRHVTFLKQKDETAKSVITFLKLFKNKTGKNIKVFKSDNGGELMSGELQAFFREEGIIHQT